MYCVCFLLLGLLILAEAYRVTVVFIAMQPHLDAFSPARSDSDVPIHIYAICLAH